MIERAIPYTRGTHNIEDIEAGIERGQFQFWAGRNCAVITELCFYPRKKLMNYFLIGGDLKELLEIEPKITEWAKIMGCEMVTGIGRKGFARATTKNGFTPSWWIVSKDI